VLNFWQLTIMASADPKPRGYRFAAFELDVNTGELRKNGIKIKLQEQPLTVLRLLLDRQGELVTREEIRSTLWPVDTFVDFDRSLNTAINRLRDALGDQAENPRFVETLPRRGYRFAFPAEVIQDAPPAPSTAISPPEPPFVPAPTLPSPQPWRLWAWRIGGLLVVVAALILYFSGWRVHPAPAGRTVLAVLPFANLSGDPAQDYFSAGQTEELITRLGRLNPAQLGVIGYTSMAAYKRDGKSLPSIGADLGAQYVVEGSVTRSGERVRVNARLIQVTDGTPVWSTSYEKDLGDILQVQSDVAQDIAEQIRIQLAPRPRAAPVNRDAYEAWLRGRYFMNRRSDEDLKKGVEYLQSAVTQDPNFALAHASLADVYSLLGFYSVLPPTEAYPKAKAEALRALELDHSLAEAHATLADLTYIYEWNWSGAEQEFQLALSLDPNYAPARQWYGMFLAMQGHSDAAIAELRKALAIDPLSLVTNADLGLCYYYARQYDRALEQYQRTLDLDNSFSLTHNWTGMALVQMHRYDEAITHFQQAVGFSGGSQGSYALLAYGYGRAGRKREALETIHSLEAMAEQHYVSPAYISAAWVGVNDREKVFAWADKAVQQHAALLARLKVEPVLDPVRNDPRYARLMEQVGLKPEGRPDGNYIQPH
jgi:TolB-like protein/DNA-binding winged helix-turn-helix (wHTH) protein/Tfp pilus assembly protein PilF